MKSLGFPLEVRAFRPHLTLGRAKRGARPADFQGMRDQLDRIDHATETLVGSVDLMETTLRPDGARYTARHVARLVR
jgi:2'-5' RNA ligase